MEPVYEQQVTNLKRLWLEGKEIPLFSITILNEDTCNLDFIFDHQEYKSRIMELFYHLAPEFPEYLFPSTFTFKISMNDDGSMTCNFNIKINNKPTSQEDVVIAQSIMDFLGTEFYRATQATIVPIFNIFY